jgi:tetratricopeptide (TPR) repeat protein
MRTPILAAALLAVSPLAAQPEPGFRPEGPPPGQRGFLYAHMARAIDEKVDLLMEQGKTDAAIEELKRAFGMEIPKEHPAYEAKAHLIARLAVTYAKAGKKKEAVETIERLLADVPAGTVAEASAWVDAGAVYKSVGMADEALKAFDKAIALSEKLAKAPRGPAGRPMPPPGGRPPGFRPPPKGDPQ